MSNNITIGQTVVPFPKSGDNEDWSGPIILFAQAVSNQLATVGSQFDISPRVQVLSTDANVNTNLIGLIFPSGFVRSFSFNYSIYRTNTVISIAETGFVNGVFNTLSSTWNLEHEFSGNRQADGTLYHSFVMTGDQLQLNTVAIGGAYDNANSKISCAAKTILVNNL